MAVALVGSAGAVATGTSSSITPAYGQTPTAGNLLVCWAVASRSSGTAAITTPSGWTAVGTSLVSSTFAANMFYKIAAGGDAAPSISASSATNMKAQLSEWSGVDTTTPFDSTSTGKASTTTGGSVTPTTSAAEANAGLAITMAGHKVSTAAATTHTPASGWTALGSYVASNAVHAAADYNLSPSTSATVSEAFAFGTGTATTLGIIAVFNVAVPPPPSPAIVRIGSVVSVTNASAAQTITVGAAGVAAGDMIVVLAFYSNHTSSLAAPTDTAGNTYTLVSGPTTDAGTDAGYFWIASSVAALNSGDTITLAGTGSSTSEGMVAAYDVQDSTATYDTSNAAGAASGNPSSGDITTASATEVLIGRIAWQTGPTSAPSLSNRYIRLDYVSPASGDGAVWAYLPLAAITSSGDAIAASFTNAGWVATTVGIKWTTGGGGTTNPVTLAVSETTTPSLLTAKTAPRTLSVSSATTPALTKAVGKTVAASETTASSVAKAIARTLSVSESTTPSLTTAKVKLLTLAVSAATTQAVTKAVTKALSVSSSTTPRLAKAVARTLALSETTTPAVAAIKAKFINLAVSAVTAASMVKQVARTLAISGATQPSVAKRITKALAVASSTTASLTAGLVKLAILAVSAGTTASIRKQVGKVVVASGVAQAGIGKRLTRGFAAVASVVSSVVGQLQRFASPGTVLAFHAVPYTVEAAPAVVQTVAATEAVPFTVSAAIAVPYAVGTTTLVPYSCGAAVEVP